MSIASVEVSAFENEALAEIALLTEPPVALPPTPVVPNYGGLRYTAAWWAIYNAQRGY